jgi:hypothetical protein
MEIKRGQRLNIMELIMETQSESLLTAPLSSALMIQCAVEPVYSGAPISSNSTSKVSVEFGGIGPPPPAP